MRNLWIRFGCFLTGYNYTIVANSSEMAAKAVKRYTAALLIVCILWSFIGYTFTQRYIHASNFGSLAGALVMVIIIIQVERQIILTMQPNRWLYVFRGVIALTMAIIGAVIIDQIIFKEDIELEKITSIEERVKQALPPKTQELRNQIAALDTAIQKKDYDRAVISNDISSNPMILSTTTQSMPTKLASSSTDSTGRKSTSEKIVYTTSAINSKVPNPKIALLGPIDQTLTNLRAQKTVKENDLLNIRPKVEEEIRSKVGFLDELKIMYLLIKGSGVALTVWLLWFFFLLGLEMLVLVSKINDKKNDYEETVMHQMNLQMKKLSLMAKLAERN